MGVCPSLARCSAPGCDGIEELLRLSQGICSTGIAMQWLCQCEMCANTRRFLHGVDDAREAACTPMRARSAPRVALGTSFAINRITQARVRVNETPFFWR